ncbi:hypothetical protein BZA70DRAFT_181599 [Myxozyma melibiosi]|uniref:Uncharacterized protein n=1 Tax=Myxozyma melibiosi TaxID=54550 RepID=A0ABR1F4H8_9ASCO
MPTTKKRPILPDDFVDTVLERAFRITRTSSYVADMVYLRQTLLEPLMNILRETPDAVRQKEKQNAVKQLIDQFKYPEFTDVLSGGLFPDIASVTTHLKLLRVFRDLRAEIMARDGMFGITDAEFPSSTSSSDNDGRLLRWQVYVAYAVERYTEWFRSLPSRGMIGRTRMSFGLHGEGEAYEITAENLPPIDVLMVLHSHMLHPRVYWQDMMRSNRMGVFRSMKMPWGALESVIQQPSTPNGAWKYNPPDPSREYFEETTMRMFELEDGINSKCVICPQCPSINSVELYNESGTGWVQSKFKTTCTECGCLLTRDALTTAALLDDCKAFEERGVPLKGALLDYLGVQYPEKERYATPGSISSDVAALFSHIPPGDDFTLAQTKVQDVFRLLYKKAISQKQPRTKEFRVLSHYVKNCTPFCIDLELAVLRQCEFADKMVKYAYLHSPFRENVIEHATVRFLKFFFLVRFRPYTFLAPPVDGDIVWLTMQLDPAGYAATSLAFLGTILEHDDDVSDNRLTDSHFLSKREWSRYAIPDFKYDGCTCAICHATREYVAAKQKTAKPPFSAKSSRRAALIDQFYAIECEKRMLGGDTLVQRLTHTSSVAEQSSTHTGPNYAHPYFADLTALPVLETMPPSYAAGLPPAYTSSGPAAAAADGVGWGEIARTRYGRTPWTPYSEFTSAVARYSASLLGGGFVAAEGGGGGEGMVGG